MSLINKMLQDLDARGPLDGRGEAEGIRSVPERERGLPRALIFGGAAGLTAVAIALGWLYLKRPPVPPMLVNVASVAAPAPAPVVAAVVTPAPVPEPVAPVIAPEPAPAQDRPEEVRRITAKPAQKAVPPVTKVAVPAAISEKIIEGKQVTPQQRVENEYRRALGYLQDGRVAEAMTGLQQTLQLDPRHQGARETLIRLLLEAQRPDEAVRQLQLSLGLDPKQPAQAMMLARLQLDKNASAALDTLMRSLPYAADNGEYRAFLAGVLQRQQRYHDAAEQYELALQTAPDNSVWWMGLGIALQADNRPAQARQAYERAKGLQTLSPQLQAFVERKLVQLVGEAK
jgi:MSHA biogenesis protein MshN